MLVFADLEAVSEPKSQLGIFKYPFFLTQADADRFESHMPGIPTARRMATTDV